MAMKEYLLNTIYGITTAEMTTEEHEALAKKAGLKVEQRAIFANAAMILELLDTEEPQASASIAELAGIDAEKSASWKRAFAALTKAGLVRRHGHGPKTAYTRIFLEEADGAPEELAAPESWARHPHQTLFYGGPASGKSNALQSVIKELAVLAWIVVDVGETSGVELELSSSSARTPGGLSCLTLMPG